MRLLYTSIPICAEIGDKLLVYRLGMHVTSHSGQLSLLPSTGREMSTDQGTVAVLCGWDAMPDSATLAARLCVMMHNIHVGKAPDYLSDTVQLTSTKVTRPDLRSSSNTASYVTPHLRTKYVVCWASFMEQSSCRTALRIR